MILSNRHGRILTVLLLLLQLCLPLSGSLCISTIESTSEASHTGIACAHTDEDGDHESQGGHDQSHHCHELDAPYDTVSGTVVKHSPLISPLTASDKCSFLPEYCATPEIPPENRA